MPRPPPDHQPREAGGALLAGVAVGTIVVLIVAAGFSGPFRLSISPARSGSLSELACAPNQCVNVTIRFSGVSSLDPASLRITVLPFGSGEVVNQTAGKALHLAFFPAKQPHWVGDYGGGVYNQSFIGDIVDPGGELVGGGGPSGIATGAVFCLKGNLTGPTQEYELAFGYMNAYVVIPFAVN
ncbi:MAG: hypothetical protein WBG19_02370 [Thermoplasmata archaeon]